MTTTKENKNRPVSPKSPEMKKTELEIALKQLRDAGFDVKEEKKAPVDGVYSGIVGKLGKLLIINTKK